MPGLMFGQMTFFFNHRKAKQWIPLGKLISGGQANNSTSDDAEIKFHCLKLPECALGSINGTLYREFQSKKWQRFQGWELQKKYQTLLFSNRHLQKRVLSNFQSHLLENSKHDRVLFC